MSDPLTKEQIEQVLKAIEKEEFPNFSEECNNRIPSQKVLAHYRQINEAIEQRARKSKEEKAFQVDYTKTLEKLFLAEDIVLKKIKAEREAKVKIEIGTGIQTEFITTPGEIEEKPPELPPKPGTSKEIQPKQFEESYESGQTEYEETKEPMIEENREPDRQPDSDPEENSESEEMAGVIEPKEMAEVGTIKINELVIKPEKFDGTKPRPRQWIEDYEDAKDANGWSDNIAVKYFPHFLIGDAKKWYKSRVKNTATLGTTKWSEIKTKFENGYIGKAEKEKVERLIENTSQRYGESVTKFIPNITCIFLSTSLQQLILQFNEKARTITVRFILVL